MTDKEIHLKLSNIVLDNDNLDYMKLTGEICGKLRWDLVELFKNNDEELKTQKSTMEDNKNPIIINGIPRRQRMDKCVPAELAIYKAMEEIENIGADVRLTEAIIILNEARNLVADFIDEQLNNLK